MSEVLGNPVESSGLAAVLLLAAVRLAGVLCIAPPTAHPAVPIRLRLFLALVVAVSTLGRLGLDVPPAATGAGLAALVVTEALVGLGIGLAVRLLFTGVEIAAGHIAQQMGIALADAMNPTGADSAGPVRRLYVLVAAVVFFAADGHLALVRSVLGSFQLMPPGVYPTGAEPARAVVSLLGAALLLALRLAGPVLAVMIALTVLMGVLQRTMPQFNVFSAAVPIRVLVGLVALAAVLTMLGGTLESSFHAMEQTLREAVTKGAAGVGG